MEKYGVTEQQQENIVPQISDFGDIQKKTRRIASKLHILASKKQLDPAVRIFSPKILNICFFLRASLSFYLIILPFCRESLTMRPELLSIFS
jgi:hypothetical protein